jgi:hypothetical protein
MKSGVKIADHQLDRTFLKSTITADTHQNNALVPDVTIRDMAGCNDSETDTRVLYTLS